MKRLLLATAFALGVATTAQAQTVHILMETVPDTEYVKALLPEFKAQTGISPKQYQLRIRLHKAQDFLANTSKSVGEIADILGFDSAFHLSKQFKDSTGLAPQAWRKRLVGLRAQNGK